MDGSIEMPIGYVVISIFIGYMYYFLKSDNYKDVISFKSIKVGIVSGVLISLIVIFVGLIEANSLDLDNFLVSLILVVFGIIFSIFFVLIGGLLGIAIKRILKRLRHQ
jgi:hypothetical protein